MFHYTNLSDFEFEALCKDIMSKMLGFPLERYGTGRDNGIDLADHAFHPHIVVQVKHYVKTDNPGLLRALEKEVPKVKKISPEKYYVCCSKSLTPDNKADIYEMFSEYMDSTQNIIGVTEIEDFLHRSENIEILHRHFKLWIESTSILTDIYSNDIFIDSEAMLADIQENYRLFVETAAYQESLSLLQKNRILIIVGQPGSGKSITSKMLVLAYAAQGYRVRYTSDATDLSSVKKSLSDSLDTKEVVLLDDCFGQAYFNMKENQGSSLHSLILFIKMHPSKALIMNSRVTIYRAALENTLALRKSKDKDQYQKYVIDLDQMPYLEKAKIFYNHLFFNELPKEYRDNIILNKNYRQIVKHSNYNPRIVEFVCTKSNWETVVPEEYTNFILDCLDNPSEIWKNEYEHRLSREDRAFLTTLYSLSNTMVPTEMLKFCYHHRLALDSDVDTSINHFDAVLSRLTGSMIKIVDVHGKQHISVANPSVNDFLNAYVSSNDSEHRILCSSVCSINQIKRLYNSNQEQMARINTAFEDLSVLEYIFEEEAQKKDYIVFWCAEQRICKTKFKEYITEFVLNPHKVDTFDLLKRSEIEIIDQLFDEPLCSFYGLPALVTDYGKLAEILNQLDLFSMAEFISRVDPLFVADARAPYLKLITDLLMNAQEDYCQDVSASDFDLDLGSFSDISSDHYDDYDDFLVSMDHQIEDIIDDQMYDIYMRLPADFPISKESWCNPEISISGSEEYLRSWFDEDSSNFLRLKNIAISRNEEEDSEIDCIFE